MSTHRSIVPHVPMAAQTELILRPVPSLAKAQRGPRVAAGSVVLLVDLLLVTVALLVSSTVGPVGALAAAGAAAAVVLVRGGQRHRLTLAVLDELPGLAAAGLLAAGVARLLTTTANPVAVGLTVTGLLLATRSIAYPLVRTARRRGHAAQRTLVVGVDATGRRMAQTALDHPEYGVTPVGFVDDEDHTGPEALPLPHLGDYADLSTLVADQQIDLVLVAGGRHDEALTTYLRECDRLSVEVLCVPRLADLHHRSRDMDELWGVPLVRFRRAAWRSASWRLKRALDVTVAGLALLLLGPLMLTAALAVRLELGKSVIYRQTRIGLGGEPFTIFKFRSLRLPEAPGDVPVWSINNDARLGPVGRFLRSTSIDELPQLLNILRGDMSLVGPRPERPAFVDRFAAEVPFYEDRHRTPVGLTGWAQVNGLRGDTSIEERARFDNYYIQNWSLWLDLRIIARTVSTVLLRRGS